MSTVDLTLTCTFHSIPNEVDLDLQQFDKFSGMYQNYQGQLPCNTMYGHLPAIMQQEVYSQYQNYQGQLPCNTMYGHSPAITQQEAYSQYQNYQGQLPCNTMYGHSPAFTQQEAYSQYQNYQGQLPCNTMYGHSPAFTQQEAYSQYATPPVLNQIDPFLNFSHIGATIFGHAVPQKPGMQVIPQQPLAFSPSQQFTLANYWTPFISSNSRSDK